MRRVFSNYSEDEYKTLKKASEDLGMSISAYQKYSSLLRLNRINSENIEDLIKEMKSNLISFEVDKPFIAATLLKDKWVTLTRSQKCTLAKILSAEIKKNPNLYIKSGTISGNISQYKKITNYEEA